MISNFLISKFIKNNEDVMSKEVRTSYGNLSGIVGVIVNFILFSVELILGLLANSVAMIADAFHNLADVTSSIVTLIGFKISNKPADKKHPFGYGRIEYISAMAVSLLIIIIGYEFIKTSYMRIIHPEPVNFSIISLIIILIAIPLKLWLSKFNKQLGKTINSSALTATGADALNDVTILIGVIVSLLVSTTTHITIDGEVGIIVAIFIILSGLSLIKETISPLLGQAPDPVLVKALIKGALEYDYIIGVHDLIIHDYGPGRSMASLHAEVPSNVSVMILHDTIDTAEKELSEKLNMHIVIHMDPINTDSADIMETRKFVSKVLKKFPIIHSMHDFRIVGEGESKNLVFDVVIDFDNVISPSEKLELKDSINKTIKQIHPNYDAVITIDRDYTH